MLEYHLNTEHGNTLSRVDHNTALAPSGLLVGLESSEGASRRRAGKCKGVTCRKAEFSRGATVTLVQLAGQHSTFNIQLEYSSTITIQA